MRKRKKAVEIKCEEAIKKIDKLLLNPEEQKKYGLFERPLNQMKKEIEEMKNILDKTKFKPMYGKFISDIPYANEELIDYFLEVSVFYNKYT